MAIRRRRIAIALLTCGLAMIGSTVLVQQFPTKPVRVLIGFAAGGPTDVTMRLIAQYMTPLMGQSVLVENKTGADMTHAPFRGNAPALTEVMAGRASFMFYPSLGVADNVASKRLDDACRSGANMVAATLEAVRAYVTAGEITDRWRALYGVFTPSTDV